MTAINFPSSPVNGDTLTSGNTTYTYNAAKTRWDAVTTVNGIQLNSLSVGVEAPASGDGSIAYNNTSGVFTYTPPVIADPLPAQIGNTGKYLTTDGSTTSWAEVASGGGLSFIQDFTASGSVTANTPVVLNSAGTVSTLGEVAEGSTAVNYGLQYAIGAQYSDGNLVYDSQNDQFIMYKYGGLKIGKMVGSSITWGSFIGLGLNSFLTTKANSVYDATLDRHIVFGPTQSNADTPTTFWQAQVGDGTYSYISESYTETSQLQSESASLWNSTQVGPVSVGPGKVLFLYRAAGTFDPTINIATGTVDSPFTFGTPVTLTSKDMDRNGNSSVAIAYSETAGVAYAAYINTSFQLEYAIIDVSGASPVVLSTHIIVQPINGDWHPSSANLVIKDNYVILGYYHWNQPFKTVGGYIDSGTKQITFGTSATSSLNAGSTGTIRIVYTKYNNFAVLQQNPSTVYNISNYTVSEQGALTSISSENVTLESAPAFQNGMLFMAFSTVDNNLLINYSTSSGTSYGYSGWRDYGFVHKAQTLGSVVSNADRFLGFATTSVADSATVPVTLVGVQGGLSGLTPATDYYITGTGSLSSGDTGYRKVGTALSSSSILMDDSSNVIGYATTSYVDTAITNLIDSSPATLNTLNELAAALGDDANFSTTVTNTLAEKASLASPTFTGVPVAPTATAGTNTTQLATTAFVTAATVAAAGDTLPAQTDNAGKYLTTDGSTTSWAEIVSTGGSKEFIANGPIAAGAPVVLDPAGTVSPVATIAANGTEMAAGHQALFPALGITSVARMLTHKTNYSTYKSAATCPITGRSVFFGEMQWLYSSNSNYQISRVIQGSAPNASATEMILGPLVQLPGTVAGANMHNVCFSGNGDGVFIITYQTATTYNNPASAGLAARLGKVDSSGNITMFNTEIVKAGRPNNFNSSYSDTNQAANQWLNSIVWDPIASKFVIVYTGYSWLSDGVKAQTTIGTALYSYDSSNTLSPAGGQDLTSLGYYGSYDTKLKALWDSTRERVTTIFFGQDRRYLSSVASDNYFHESIFDVIDGEIQPLVPITAPIPYASTTTAVWAFQTDMVYNPTQGTFLLLPDSSNSNESIFYSFAFDGSVVSSLVAVGRPSTLLKGIDNTGTSYYRDIIYEASSDSITIAYSAPNMTYGGTHANKNSIYTATLDASDYTSVLSNIEAYDASWRGNVTLWYAPTSTSYARVGVAPAQYVELNWSPILNKFLMYRQTDELDSYQVNYAYTQSTADRYRDAYDLVQVISVSNYPQAIGFSEGTVSDGTPVPVTLAGGVNTNQSGLSIERNYFFQTDGSLGTNRTDYLVGLALSDTELQVADLSDLDNVNLSLYATTSALASKAPLASPTFTGVPVAPTATAGTNTTQIATTAFVTAAAVAAAGDTLPAQTGNTGKYLTTDGSTTSWDTVSAGATIYANVAELPLSGVPAGAQAFVSATNRLYLWNGTGWYNIALINTAPTITTSGDAQYTLAQDGTATVVTLEANDPEGIPITWSYVVTTGSLGSTATVSQVNNVFTITPSTLEADAGSFTLTFTASDGVNLATSASQFSLVFAFDWSLATQQAKIQASDAQATDYFGYSVSISDDGNTAIVGAYYEDTGGTDAGAAYIFVRSGSTWTEQAKIQASDKGTTDRFGTSVSISDDGNTAIVGAYYEDTGGTDAGAAYIFVRSGSTWTEQAKIQASDKQAGDKFGNSVSISIDGNTAIVGASQKVNGSWMGASYIFVRSGSTWAQQAKIEASDKQHADTFGGSVSISDDGNTVIVGAYGEDTGGDGAGAAYIFVRSGSTWTEQVKIQSSDIEAGDIFAYAVSISGDGNTVIVGAHGEDTGGPDAGAAYIFTRSGSTWTEQAKIQSSDIEFLDNFGISVSISSDGNIAIVGAHNEDTGGPDAGAAYIFTRSGSTWTEQVKIQSSDKEAYDQFGQSVSISGDGNTVITGAGTEDTGGDSAGAAYIFVAG